LFDDHPYKNALKCIYCCANNSYNCLNLLISSDNNNTISKEEFENCKNVRVAFLKLQTKLTTMLMKANFLSIRRGCIAQQKTPGGAQLPEQLKSDITNSQNIDMLLDVLVDSPYWSWIDIRLLQAIVITSDLPQASQLLENYTSAIFSKKLINLLPNIPSKEIKEAYYAKLVTKLEKDASNMTVADLLEFQTELETVIMDIGQGTCVLEHIKKGCPLVYSYPLCG